MLGRGQYYLDYPEDIRLFGASFLHDVAHRHGLDRGDQLPAKCAGATEHHRPDPGLDQPGRRPGGVADSAAHFGADNTGYRRKEITQFQSSMTQFFDQVLGAERLTVVGEAAVVHVAGLERQIQTALRPRLGVWRNTASSGDTDGFVTATSWGYRARAILDYNNAIAGVNLKPNLSWSHDVARLRPQRPVQQRRQGASASGVDADYRSTYTASLSYTDFFGGDYNTLTDRDFLALSFGVNF
jgi:hypothetical protein